ncbi:MAG: tRNA 4-thiouridine(8) synthase ThiI, partial [bacterium]
MKEKTCLALFSGGLDSMLAVLYMEKLGFNVIPVNFNIGVFFKKYIKEDGKLKYAKKMPFKNAVEVIDISSDFLKMLKAPPHGFGKHMNPCIDCKILMLKKAKEIMEKYNAGFVITGEVLGQRPMSQNPSAAKKIRDESGLEGFLVRPLCAKAMEPTEPEKLGWIDRESLLGITGRGRKQQIEMAKEFGIDKDIETPGGGCLLTEGQYAKRLKDFMTHNKDKELNEKDMFILSAGRHFRKGNIKFII